MPFRPLKSFFSTADDLLLQDLPTLGAVLLTHLKSYQGLNTVYQHAGLNRGYFRAMLENRNVGHGSLPKEPEYGVRQLEVTKRMMEAWNWLERQGLLIRNDEQVADWFIISSNGEELLKSGGLPGRKDEGAGPLTRIADTRPFRWEDLDNRLLSPKLQELSNEMQKKSVEGERTAAFDTRRSSNSAGYLPRLFDFQEKLTDEWAQRVYAAHCESWSQQNRTVTGEFIRAIRDRAVIPLIATRKSTVQFEVSLRGTRIGENPNSTSLGEWNRRMDRLAARWSQRLEADAVAEEYRASRPAGVHDDRHFTLLAIEEAKKSVAEDDRPHPKVGAVVVKDGRVLAKAHRGENPKSHAEYVALEEKLSNETLAGATVYTTLEPFIKRNPPKICCAQRLIDRKVARVFIGMLDPNPDIRGLGDQLLNEAGIEVQLFPRDLRAQVEELNRDFIRDQKEKRKLRTSSTTAMPSHEFRNPQIRSEFLGEYPDGPTLWVTSDREIMLTQLDYLDLHEAKVDGDKIELSGQDFRLPIDQAKLVKISNLVRAGGDRFRMKFRVEVTTSGRSISHVIPAIIEPAMKLIQGTMTGYMRIVGSTTGYAL
jgi:pyrimidine deaminase RibD-like protein